MKLELSFTDMVMFKAVLDHTSRINTNMGVLLYKAYKDSIATIINIRNRIIGETETEIEEEHTNPETGKVTKLKVKKIPQDKIEEVNQKINELTTELNLDSMIYPAAKNAVLNFPNVVIDPKTGEKGLRGEGDILAYEGLKLKFN